MTGNLRDARILPHQGLRQFVKRLLLRFRAGILGCFRVNGEAANIGVPILVALKP